MKLHTLTSATLKPSTRQIAELMDMGLGDRLVVFPPSSWLEVAEHFPIDGHHYVLLKEPFKGLDRGFFWAGSVALSDEDAIAVSDTQPEKVTYPEWDLDNAFASRIIRYMMNKQYRICDGFRERNIIFLEGINTDGVPNSDRLDRWNDVACVISFDKGKPYFAQKPCTATTEPGRYYTDRPMNKKGAFRIAFGQYAAWKYGRHGSDWHEALVQCGDITGHRDLNKDGIRTGDKTDTGSDFYVNIHGSYTYGNVGVSSAGCLVREHRRDHEQFMYLVKSDPRYLRSPSHVFDATIINGHEFNSSRWGYGK